MTARKRTTEQARIVLAGLIIYVVSFILPADFGGSSSGYDLFGYGFFGLRESLIGLRSPPAANRPNDSGPFLILLARSFPWLANPLMWIGFMGMFFGFVRVAFICAAYALLLAVVAVVTSMFGLMLSPAFHAWWLSMALLGWASTLPVRADSIPVAELWAE